MAYNLFIAYDLISPGRNYDAVRDRIKSLGPWAQLQLSLFYVSSDKAPHDAYAHVGSAMDVNDRLAVIVAADFLGAVLSTWDRPPIEAINSIWVRS
ncbi:hypothetical protein PQJ75_05505 [Rhodoplanes sp. TEM]|uniref:Uncharacterized protein n=1 Tax=Rhodoplanes tepidamans TaxID=200616 RepID=A0ABT5J405_RHOTP|nr:MULTISPECIES: hypothetical protein [Rhodoplanes]MDC7784084.1 hypothetical protein [Rhodoplanes tepidamans]MDC7983179.1 hypothetical protein [Rhodoplanes sp. TEM]MDQ0356819.1 hypothetical protein [Rhodoplanes tepidamans]